jgi:hypothetical protein
LQTGVAAERTLIAAAHLTGLGSERAVDLDADRTLALLDLAALRTLAPRLGRFHRLRRLRRGSNRLRFWRRRRRRLRQLRRRDGGVRSCSHRNGLLRRMTPELQRQRDTDQERHDDTHLQKRAAASAFGRRRAGR